MVAGESDGCERIYYNLKYMLSSRFNGENEGKFNALEQVFMIIRTFVINIKSEILLEEAKVIELLQMIATLKVDRSLFKEWTNCIGGFMTRMGGIKFFQILPVKLIDYDLNSLKYAQDSRSWLI